MFRRRLLNTLTVERTHAITAGVAGRWEAFGGVRKTALRRRVAGDGKDKIHTAAKTQAAVATAVTSGAH
jgi:hypothetical protein